MGISLQMAVQNTPEGQALRTASMHPWKAIPATKAFFSVALFESW
jgi:hypothetical protein